MTRTVLAAALLAGAIGASFAAGSPLVSPDGRRVAFVSERGGGPGIHEAGIDGASLRRLDPPPHQIGRTADSNSAGFSDRTGDKADAYAGQDITGLEVANDDAGLLTFRVHTASHKQRLGTYDGFVGIMLDLDQNPDTGSLFYGAEVGFQLSSDGLSFWRLSGFHITSARRPASLHAAFKDGTATFTIEAQDLGLSPSSGFNVLARSVADWAPDHGTFNYQLVAGTPAPDPGADTTPPVVHAFSSQGSYIYGAQLDYRVADGRGETADVVSVYRGARLVRVIRERLAKTNPFEWYSVGWRIHHKVRPGRLRFCVRSTDAAGNESRPSCAKLLLD